MTIESYQINRFYAKRIEEIAAATSLKNVLLLKVSSAYIKHDLLTLNNLFELYGESVLKRVICLALSKSRDFDLAKHIIRNGLKNVPSYKIYNTNLKEEYDSKKLKVDISDDVDFIWWKKLFDPKDKLFKNFEMLYITTSRHISKKRHKNDFELSQLEFLGIPFEETDTFYEAKTMLKNSIYLLASDMMTDRNVSKSVIVGFQKQKLCVEDLKYQSNFIKNLKKLNSINKNKALRFIEKFKTIATERQLYNLNKLESLLNE